MSTKSWRVETTDHPGSSLEDIENEPKWTANHRFRIGYKGPSGRIPGLTHSNDEWTEEDQRTLEAWEKFFELRLRAKHGQLVNFRDVIQNQEDFHLRKPENRFLGWRYVLEATESWVKNQDWPINIRKQQREHENTNSKKEDDQGGQKPQSEHEWKREQGRDSKHNDAYAQSRRKVESASKQNEDTQESEDEYKRLLTQYTSQEIALLRGLQYEKEYVTNLQKNDGKRKSPQTRNRTQISIDEKDQFSPDNWIPRSSDLIRVTGKHPLNAEPDLSHLHTAGLVTPNELHYVRNHGAVPRILWEYHEIVIQGGMLRLSMDDLKNKFESINICVLLACDGNRRKELNMIRQSKGFNFGSGAVSCAYWKGPLVRDVLLAAGLPEKMPDQDTRRYWVNFEGDDEPSEGKYATCVTLEHIMEITNDVILAYEMNDLPLPPDHGYPVRVIIPGYVGGRCVKWVKNIWISHRENDSHYHIWDNRVLPGFIREKDGEFAQTMFHHPDTACNEQNLNSVIVKPAQGEQIPLTEARQSQTYRIEGFAYDGGGHEVQGVEVSLDSGETWLYCIRQFPDTPIRHGRKFWTWVFWHVDIAITHLLRAKSIIVRCHNVFKNTQPADPSWNIMGMMNNCWYVVKAEIVTNENSNTAAILFQHPVEPGTGKGGWKKNSVENQIINAKNESGIPQKQFTRAEIEKHDSEDDCWIVIDGKVYDATSVLSWHPGGKAPILGHAGKIHQDTSEEFGSIHDDFAYKKLKECNIGTVTNNVMNFIKETAKESTSGGERKEPDSVALQKHRWVPARLLNRKPASEDTRTYTFQLPGDKTILGMSTCQHVEIGFHFRDRMVIRPYTPTRPLLPATSPSIDSKHDEDNNFAVAQREPRDGNGTFDLTIKTYFPDENQPGGAMSNILDCIPFGEEVEIRGPTGEITYNGKGAFVISGTEYHFDRVSLVLGGSGVTPGYSLIGRILLDKDDATKISVIDGNKTEIDILMRDELHEFEKNSNGQLRITHVLSHADDNWKGLRGYVTEDIIKEHLFGPGKGCVALLCGPPAMVTKTVLPALTDWGYIEGENMFGF